MEAFVVIGILFILWALYAYHRQQRFLGHEGVPFLGALFDTIGNTNINCGNESALIMPSTKKNKKSTISSKMPNQSCVTTSNSVVEHPTEEANPEIASQALKKRSEASTTTAIMFPSSPSMHTARQGYFKKTWLNLVENLPSDNHPIKRDDLELMEGLHEKNKHMKQKYIPVSNVED